MVPIEPSPFGDSDRSPERDVVRAKGASPRGDSDGSRLVPRDRGAEARERRVLVVGLPSRLGQDLTSLAKWSVVKAAVQW